MHGPQHHVGRLAETTERCQRFGPNGSDHVWAVLHPVVVAGVGGDAAEEGQSLLGLAHGQPGPTLCDVGRDRGVRELPEHGHLLERFVVAPHPAQDVRHVADGQPAGDVVCRCLCGTGELRYGLLASTSRLESAAVVHQRVGMGLLVISERGLGQAEIALTLVAPLEDTGLVAVVQDPGSGQGGGPQWSSRVVGGHDLFVESVSPGAGTTTEQPKGAVHRSWITCAMKVFDGDEVCLNAHGRVEDLAAHRIGIRPKPFVGVDGEHPFASGVGQGRVAGLSERVLPVTLDHPGSSRAGDVARGVTRAGVVDDDLVSHVAQRVETVGQHRLLVLDDQAHAQQRQRARQGFQTPLIDEATPVGGLHRLPVDVVGIEGCVTMVMDKGPVRHHQTQAELLQAGAEIVVLESSDGVALVESAEVEKRIVPDGQTKADKTAHVGRLTPVLVAPGGADRMNPSESLREYRTAAVAWWPDTLSERGPTAPTPGWANGPTSSSSHPSVTTVSLLRNTRASRWASAAPWLQACAKPRFSALTTVCTQR